MQPGKRLGKHLPASEPFKKGRIRDQQVESTSTLEVLSDYVETCQQQAFDAALAMESEKDAVTQMAEVADHLHATKNNDAGVKTDLWQGFLV
jgi:hypothetical protein